jgi:hypothetical protein
MFWGQFAEDGDIARYNPHLYNLGEYNVRGLEIEESNLSGVDNMIFTS